MAAAGGRRPGRRCGPRSTRSTTPSSIPRAERPSLPLLPPGEARALRRRGARPGARPAGAHRSCAARPLIDGGLRVRHDRPARAAARRDHARSPTSCAADPQRSTAPAAARAPAGRPGSRTKCWSRGGPFTMGTSTEPWALDNERPAHQVAGAGLPHRHRRRSPTAPTRRFIADGGYDDPRWWTPAGWASRPGAGLARAAVLAAGRAGSGCAAGSGDRARAARRAGDACELVRGRRLRPLGGQAAAHRGRVGEGRPPRPGDRPLPPLPLGRRRPPTRTAPTWASGICGRRRPGQLPGRSLAARAYGS